MSDRDVRLGPMDLHLLGEGTHARLFEKMGAQVAVRDGQKGTQFSVWAPNAETIDVLGDWNDWLPGATPMKSLGPSGVWQAFAREAAPGHRYKLHIRSREGGYTVDKADPFAFASEVPPAKASVIAAMDYAWKDGDWMRVRRERNALDAPLS
ncbi:MAG: 1,4-alpha-glucan branching enzyme, partial [Verrucomicrobiota bacterium]